VIMREIKNREDDWLRRASAAAIAEARKVALEDGSLRITPLERISGVQWGWLVEAAIFGWVTTRCQQAIEEGLSEEQAVRLTGVPPSPCDVAVIRSVLPALCDQAGIDWTQPLSAWSKDAMTNFLLLAWRLIDQAEAARDRGAGEMMQRLEEEDTPPAVPVIPSTISGVLASLLNFGRFGLKDLVGEMPDPLDLIDLAANLKDIADALKRSQKQAVKV
jgi:hypothetical protein